MEYQNDWLIFECIAGSHLYGTNTPESDLDWRGVCIPPFTVRDNPFIGFDQKEFSGEDRVVYNLKKFIQLASDCNPNIVELLFAPPYYTTKRWEYLLENRGLFLSRKARFTFTGYATSQLKRIELHRAWLLNPPKIKPTRQAYDLPDTPLFGLEMVTNIVNSPRGVIKDEWLAYAEKERSYRDAKQYWDNYENWKNTRNEKRAELEAKFGYDTKHGMHLYRLLSEGQELLATGIITLPRPDKDLLLEIRNGVFTYDQLISMVGDFQKILDSTESQLPEKPDYHKLENLYHCLVQSLD